MIRREAASKNNETLESGISDTRLHRMTNDMKGITIFDDMGSIERSDNISNQ